MMMARLRFAPPQEFLERHDAGQANRLPLTNSPLVPDGSPDDKLQRMKNSMSKITIKISAFFIKPPFLSCLVLGKKYAKKNPKQPNASNFSIFPLLLLFFCFELARERRFFF